MRWPVQSSSTHTKAVKVLIRAATRGDLMDFIF